MRYVKGCVSQAQTAGKCVQTGRCRRCEGFMCRSDSEGCACDRAESVGSLREIVVAKVGQQSVCVMSYVS